MRVQTNIILTLIYLRIAAIQTFKSISIRLKICSYDI